jgi:hypothetical protein
VWVAAGYLLAIVPADFVMSRQMLHGVKSRAELTWASDIPIDLRDQSLLHQQG